MKKTKEKLPFLCFIWMWFGVKVLGWRYVDIYSPDKENVEALTFSDNEKYIEKVGRIEKRITKRS